MEGWDEQNLDLYCSWPFSFIICLFRHLIVYAAKWHWSHLNGFSPVCFLWWILSDWVPSYRKKYPSFFKPIFRKLQDDLKSSLHMIFFAPQNTLNWFHTDCDYFNSNPFRPQSNKRLAKYFQTMFQFGLIFWSDHHINIFWILKDHHHRPCVSAGVGESHGRGDQIMAASYQLPTPPPSFPPLPPHSPSSSYSSLSSVSFFHISPPFSTLSFPFPSFLFLLLILLHRFTYPPTSNQGDEFCYNWHEKIIFPNQHFVSDNWKFDVGAMGRFIVNAHIISWISSLTAMGAYKLIFWVARVKF